jgi:hypothetical protein
MEDIDEYSNWYNKTELINLYVITEKVFDSWLEDIVHLVGKEKGRRYTPKQSEVIFQNCGIPPLLRKFKKENRLEEYFRSRVIK